MQSIFKDLEASGREGQSNVKSKVVHLVDALKLIQPELDGELALTCAIAISGAGCTTLDEFFGRGESSITGLRQCSAAGKAALRKAFYSKQANLRQPIRDSFKRNKPDEDKVSGESICKAIDVAKAMRVQRPDCGPAAMCKRLAEEVKGPDKKGWYLEVARLEAICGNMASIHSVKSAVNCWCKFARAMSIANEGAELPPTPNGLLAWSRVFAVRGTFNNYLSMLALACQIAGVNATAFEHPCLKKAKRTIGSLEAAPRTKRAIQLTFLEQLISVCSL